MLISELISDKDRPNKAHTGISGAFSENRAPRIDQLRQSVEFLTRLIDCMILLGVAIIVSFWVDWLPLTAANLSASGSFLIGLLIARFGLMFLARSQKLRIGLNSLLLLPVLGTWIIFNNGYLALTFAPLTIMLTILACRNRQVIALSIVFIGAWAWAESLSAVQTADVYVPRLLVAAGILIWPLHTLLEYQTWSLTLRLRALSQLFFGTFAGLAVVLVIASTPQQYPPIIGTLSLILVFTWILRTRQHLITANVARVFALTISVLYFIAISNTGFPAAMFLPVLALMFYLVLPISEAVLLSLFTLMAGSYGYLTLEQTEVDLTPFFLRWAVLSLIFIGMLQLIAQRFNRLDRERAGRSAMTSIKRIQLILVAITAAVLSGLLVWTIHHGFDGHLKVYPVPREDLNVLLLNIFTWLFISSLVTRFWLNFTQLKERESELQQAKAELESTVAELTERRDKQAQLFSIIGHELRTPLATVKMLHNELDIQSLGARGEELVGTTESLMNILDDLRSVVRPETARSISAADDVPFDVVERCINGLSSTYREKGIRVHFKGDSFASERHRFGSQALRQIVTNLLKNAAIHSKASDVWVDIGRAQQPDDKARIRVRIEDNGVGIQGAKRQRLYEAFSRGATDADGTGLGLYISKELAAQLGGDLDYFDSERGGAGFELSFEVDTPLSKTSEAPEETLRSLEGMKILFAEDQLTLRMLTTKMLEKQGAEVVAVNDGAEALAAIGEQDFELVLTDINMPNMNGYELTETLRAQSYTGRILGLTAAIIGDETDRLSALGADDVLSKPINIDELKRVLTRLESTP